MAAASITLTNMGRGPNVFGNLSGILITVTATATVYATASGGLPIDLTGVLQQGAPAGFDAPNYIQAINPADVVGLVPISMSTNGWIPMSAVIGTPTYNAVPWQSDNGTAATPGILATCPATFRIWGTGAGNAQHFAEIGDGAVTDTFTFILLINRSGANN